LHLDLRKLLAQVLSVLELADLRDVKFDLARELNDWLGDPDTQPIHNRGKQRDVKQGSYAAPREPKLERLFLEMKLDSVDLLGDQRVG